MLLHNLHLTLHAPVPTIPPSISLFRFPPPPQLHEAHLAIAASAQMGVRPVLGVRAKLSSRHDGVWGETSGEKAKFGLTVSEVVELVGLLDRVSEGE